MKQKQKGFAAIELVLIILVVLVLGAVGFFVLTKKGNDKHHHTDSAPEPSKDTALIKHLGVNLDYYDPTTNKAGDFEFTKAKFNAGIPLIFTDYGYVIKGDMSSTGNDKANPQPTFILPIGTKVHSIVDGEVYDVPQLYSGDYSVMVKTKGSDLIFETEHVKNVKVKKGDKVKAGDVVGEVSDYDAKGYNGMGLVEIGILQGGNPPKHICPFNYLDPSIKEETLKKIAALKKSWEEYRGDTTLYDEAKEVTPGCLTADSIEG